MLSYPHHLGDPAQAWPARARELVPGPVAFYATLAALLLPALAAAVVALAPAWQPRTHGARARAGRARATFACCARTDAARAV